MKSFYSSIAIVILLFISCNHVSHDYLDIKLNDVVSQNDSICKIQKSNFYKKDVLLYHSNKNLTILTPDSAMQWDSLNYLVLDVYHDNPFSLAFSLYFFKQHEEIDASVQQGGEKNVLGKEVPNFVCKVGILPQLRTQIIFPLSYLDNQNIFLQRFPRQLKATMHGHRMEKTDIRKIALGIKPHEKNYEGRLEIAAAYLSKVLPPALPPLETPIVDEFGQWKVRDWQGKIKSEKQLKEHLLFLEEQASKATFSSEWSKYGGYKEKKFTGSGFFRTHHDGKRWWMADPEGYAFLSVGIDCIRDNTANPVKGSEDLFQWIPPKTDSIFKNAHEISKRGTEVVDYYRANLMRVYGSEWREKWEIITTGLIKEWNVNTIACWSDIVLARKAQVPYLFFMTKYPTAEVLLFRDFPDVFAPEFEKNAVAFAKQLEATKDDPFMIGYFLNNEPHWAFGEHNIAFEMFATPTGSESKKMFTNWLKQKYHDDLNKWNAEWKTSFASFDELNSKTFKEKKQLSSAAIADMWEYTKVLVKRYVEVACREVKKVDKNHLNLGLRYAWISSELCYEAGSFFDVFSINGYTNPAPPSTSEIAKRSGKPVMIGEFHFGAIDRGLPANGIQAAESQAARGDAYRYYVEQGLTRPELIGMHYFQWLDQPITGRFDGENYNIGLIDICNVPYKEVVEAMKATHQRMYKVAAGKEQPFNTIIKKIPNIYY